MTKAEHETRRAVLRKVEPVMRRQNPKGRELTDAEMDAIGARLAEALMLKRDSEHADRWRTDWGTKTNKGLHLTLREMLDRIEHGEESTI